MGSDDERMDKEQDHKGRSSLQDRESQMSRKERTTGRASSPARPGGAGSAAAKPKDKEEDKKKGKEKDKDEQTKEAVLAKRKQADFWPGQKKMLTMLVKQVLQNTQATRELQAVIYDVMTVKADLNEIVEMKRRIVAYSEKRTRTIRHT